MDDAQFRKACFMKSHHAFEQELSWLKSFEIEQLTKVTLSLLIFEKHIRQSVLRQKHKI